MGKKKEGENGRKSLWSGLSLVDRCLLLFFAVLLFQSACSIFRGGNAGAEAEHIDVIVRISLASIFGYILSANFAGGGKRRGGTGESENGQDSVSAQSVEGEGERGEQETDPAKVQILTAAAIGLISLIILLLYRSLGAGGESGYATAAAAQLRDFVSGCVGFLIGSPAEQK